MKLVWSERAERDLIAIADYIAVDDPTAALRWIDRLRERAMRAASLPHAGRRVPEMDRDDLREVFLRSYRLIYRIERVRIVMLTVVEGHQTLDPAVDE